MFKTSLCLRRGVTYYAKNSKNREYAYEIEVEREREREREREIDLVLEKQQN